MNLGKLVSKACPHMGETRLSAVFPFLSIESYTDNQDSAFRKNLNTASQALHNMYLLMRAADNAIDFFEKVRFYSAVISSEYLELRVHRAVKLDQQHYLSRLSFGLQS